jgi:hypothetical protein
MSSPGGSPSVFRAAFIALVVAALPALAAGASSGIAAGVRVDSGVQPDRTLPPDGPAYRPRMRMNLEEFIHGATSAAGAGAGRAVASVRPKRAAAPLPLPSDAAGYDYHDAFQAALEALYDNGGGILEVNPGEYRLCREVDFSPARPPKGFRRAMQPTIIIRGAGGENQSVKIHCPGTFKGTGSRPALFRFRGRPEPVQPYAVWMEHLSLVGPDSGGREDVTGIALVEQCTAIHLRDVHFRSLRKALRMEEGVGRFTVDYCKFSGMGETALDVSGSGDGSISRCEFADIGSPDGGGPASAAIHAKGNTVITENIFGSCRQAAIRVHPDLGGEITVTGNEFDRNGWILDFGDKPGQAGSRIHYTTNCEFSGNKVLGWNGVGDIYGRKDDPVQTGYIRGRFVSNLQVKNNRFAGLAAPGIGIDLEDAEDIQIEGNSFSPNWASTWQPILGTVFRFRNARAVSISGNTLDLGWKRPVPIAPRLADFFSTQGEFRSNTVSGLARGVREDAASRMRYRGNSGGARPADVFSDAEGWITVPDESEILIPDLSGKGALRASRYAKQADSSFRSGKPGRVLGVLLPKPGASAATVGGVLKVRVYAWTEDGGTPGIYEQTFTVGDSRGSKTGPAGRKRGSALSLGAEEGGWGKGTFTLEPPVAGNRDVEILFATDSPGAKPYRAAISVEYEEWGGLRLR